MFQRTYKLAMCIFKVVVLIITSWLSGQIHDTNHPEQVNILMDTKITIQSKQISCSSYVTKEWNKNW